MKFEISIKSFERKMDKYALTESSCLEIRVVEEEKLGKLVHLECHKWKQTKDLPTKCKKAVIELNVDHLNIFEFVISSLNWSFLRNIF